MPIVVPRLGALDECVDEHQVSFAEHLAALGQIALATTEAQLHAEVDRALQQPELFRIEPDSRHVAATVTRFGQLVDELLTRRPARSRRRPALPS